MERKHLIFFHFGTTNASCFSFYRSFARFNRYGLFYLSQGWIKIFSVKLIVVKLLHIFGAYR